METKTLFVHSITYDFDYEEIEKGSEYIPNIPHEFTIIVPIKEFKNCPSQYIEDVIINETGYATLGFEYDIL